MFTKVRPSEGFLNVNGAVKVESFRNRIIIDVFKDARVFGGNTYDAWRGVFRVRRAGFGVEG